MILELRQTAVSKRETRPGRTEIPCAEELDGDVPRGRKTPTDGQDQLLLLRLSISATVGDNQGHENCGCSHVHK
jgi:hypothetical protein